jgi:hypothetical protein
MQSPHISSTSTSSTTNSFIGLKAYSEADAASFFGRDQEADQLYRMIKTHTLTSVFGKSGTGKTSLLNAGVFPKLREDNCLPFRIRLDFSDASPTLKDQVWQVLYEQITHYGFKISSLNSGQSFWEFFHKEDLWKIVTPVLVFDQFEEIFTLVKKQSPRQQEIEHLIEELADLIENTIPEKLKLDLIKGDEQIRFNYKTQRAKIIFAFREDFLPEMESITSRIPSVKNSRFRLTAMNGEQAYDVITKTWKDKINAGEAKKIVYYLTKEKQQAGADNSHALHYLIIEPSLLSQVCTYLDKERLREGQESISSGFLDKYPKEIILSTIYHEAIDECMPAQLASLQGALSINPVQKFIEERLINEEGYRTKFASGEIGSDLKPGIDLLQHKYFIREEGPAIELTHDVIAAVAKDDRDRRRKKAAQLHANARAKRKALRIFAIAAGLALITWVASAFIIKREVDTAKDEVKIAGQKADSLYKQIQLEDAQLRLLTDSIKNIRLGIRGEDSGDTSSVTEQQLEDSIRDLHAELFNARQLIIIQKIKADSSDYYVGLINQKNGLIADYEQRLKYFDQLQTDWNNAKQYNRMFISHVDSMVKFRTNADNLQYHIGVVETNLPGFRRVLKY